MYPNNEKSSDTTLIFNIFNTFVPTSGNKRMDKKQHRDHPHLTGEHRWGDTAQLIFFVVFMGIWITDSFVFHYSTSPLQRVPDILRIILALPVLVAGWILARRGLKAIFGTPREQPELIQTGVFRIVRHPIYTGAILFYLAAVLYTMSLASAAFWLLIIALYYLISKYEERLLTEAFGDDYLNYKKKTGMLFPKLR
jgi:protein-S-isoprenylcysteine O-methyltransferase Ste14